MKYELKMDYRTNVNYNNNDFYFFVLVYYEGKPFVNAHVDINRSSGTANVDWYYASDLRVKGFWEGELVEQIKNFCYENIST